MTKGRDDALKALLPSIDSPYSFHNLSEAETKALEEALSDGFGQRNVLGSKQLPLPQNSKSGQKIESGLLQFSYFDLDTSNGTFTEEYEDDEHPIWYPGPEDQPAPFREIPLGFITRRLRIYFDNQLDRFREHVARERSGGVSLDRVNLERLLAMHRLFEKPWYEFHAIELLERIQLARVMALDSKKVPLAIVVASGFSGQLGRLVEQYYWKFRFEKAAISGVGARVGASHGGVSKAREMKKQQSRWQTSASEIWKRHPKWSKMAVAEEIKEQTDKALTAKHISRYISKPNP